MRTIVICFRNLPAVSLGCYGELRIPTPAFDSLAAESLICEGYYISPAGDSFVEHPAFPALTTLLIHDGPVSTARGHSLFRSAAWDGKSSLAQVVLDCSGATRVPIPELIVIELNEPQITAEALCEATGVWAEQEHERVFESLDSKGRQPDAVLSSEEIAWGLAALGDAQARLVLHAAGVMMMDQRLNALLEEVDSLLAEKDVLVVTALSGDAARVDEAHPPWLASISEPVVHVPLLIRQDPSHGSARLDLLLQTEDVCSAIVAAQRESNQSLQSALASLGRGTIRYRSQWAEATRSQGWLLVKPLVQTSTAREGCQDARLFHKPEDVWEVLDVSGQYPELLEGFTATGEISVASGSGRAG